MKKISSLIFTNYKVLISRISKSNYLSFSKTVNKQPFFFLLRTISYQIISNYKEHKRDQNFYSSKNTFESVLLSLLHLLSLFSSRPKSPRCHEFHAGHSVYRDRKRERMDRVYPWTGPCNFVCRERFVCWKNIDGVLSRSSWPEERWKRRGDIDSKKIAECFSPRLARSLTVNCV